MTADTHNHTREHKMIDIEFPHVCGEIKNFFIDTKTLMKTNSYKNRT